MRGRVTPTVQRTIDRYHHHLEREGAEDPAQVVADELGLSRKTVLKHLSESRRAGPTKKPTEPALTRDNPGVLRARIHELETQLKAVQKETTDALYVREKIIGLTGQTPDPPEWIIKAPRSKNTPGVPTLFVSDWHWTEVVEPAQVGGVNAYNLTIAHERARTLIEHTIDLLTNHVVNPSYPGIVLALGGDMFSGDIHEELATTNEKPIMSAFLDLEGVLIWSIKTLADRFGRVFIAAVPGNHGRSTKRVWYKNRAQTNFDWLLYQVLAKHFEADKRITFVIPDGPDCIYRIYNTTFLLNHGDQFKGGDGIIGFAGPVLRGDKKKRAKGQQIRREYDVALFGHWHQFMATRHVIVNGALKGYDEYAHGNNFDFEPPLQALWLTHPEWGITFTMPVMVDRAKKITAPQWVSWTD